MIRINLIAVERPRARTAFAFGQGQQLAVACALVLVVSLAGIGWWYWSLDTEATRLDAEIAVARQDAAKLRALLHEVEQFEARRTQLQQRVTLIEQLRKGQSAPVQLLDHVSRSLPDMMWLTSMEQSNGTLTLEGRSTTLIALSDFVANLGANDLLKKPIDIVNSQAEPAAAQPAAAATAGSDVIKFTVKAQLANGASAPAGGLTGAERAAAAAVQAPR